MLQRVFLTPQNARPVANLVVRRIPRAQLLPVFWVRHSMTRLSFNPFMRPDLFLAPSFKHPAL